MATRKAFTGFESDSLGSWVPSGSFNIEKGDPQVVTTATNDGFSPRTGSKMLQVNHAGSSTFDSPRFQTNGNYTDEFLLRVWYRFDSNVSKVTGLHYSRFFNTGAWIDWLFGTWDDPPGGDSDSTTCVININTVTQQQAYGSLNDLHGAAWHKQEWYFKLSTGHVKTWIDGTAYADISGLNLNGTVPEQFHFLSNWTPAPPDSTNHIYYDDFEFFSDATDGEACTGSMSDASIQVSADPGNFPQVTLLDEFSGAAGTALPTYDSTNWGAVTGVSNLQINSAGDGAISASGTASNYWKTANFGPNLDVTLKVKVKPASTNYLGVIVRGSGLNSATTLSGYLLIAYVQAGTDVIAVYPITNGSVGTLITSVSQEFSIGDEIGMRIDGSTFKLYYKASAGSWARVGTDATNTTYTSAGQVSLLVDAALGEFDNVQIKTETPTAIGSSLGGLG